MTFDRRRRRRPLDGAATKFETQTICRGPVAALVAIKQSGTNGGGFFGPNSTHPFENPTPWSNLLAVASIVDAADGLDRHGRDDDQEHEARGRHLRRHARDAGVGPGRGHLGRVVAQRRDRRLPVVRDPNMEGKEVRVGPVARRPPGPR